MNEWTKEAFRLYCLGLNSKEIGKLLDLSYRTIQGAMSRENWKELRQELREREERRIIKRYLKQMKNAEA
ncbi:MAG: hypothetical protein AAFP77_16310 [Bacteroidota bacterium]